MPSRDDQLGFPPTVREALAVFLESELRRAEACTRPLTNLSSVLL